LGGSGPARPGGGGAVASRRRRRGTGCHGAGGRRRLPGQGLGIPSLRWARESLRWAWAGRSTALVVLPWRWWWRLVRIGMVAQPASVLQQGCRGFMGLSRPGRASVGLVCPWCSVRSTTTARWWRWVPPAQLWSYCSCFGDVMYLHLMGCAPLFSKRR
jgi:hypothetical protein